MNAITEAFKKAKGEGRAAVIPYLTAGYPDPAAFLDLAAKLAESADLLEVGLPYSDPLGDGPVIQRASERALAQGVRTKKTLDLVSALRERVRTPILLMTYLNPVLAWGAERFFAAFAEAGVSGVIFPDLPAGEDDAVAEAASAAGLLPVFLAAPTSTDERLAVIARASKGFVYVVSVTGVTGARDQLPQELGELMRRVRRFTSLPLAVGFGISGRATAQAARKAGADGVVVGSALIRAIEAGEDPLVVLQAVREGASDAGV